MIFPSNPQKLIKKIKVSPSLPPVFDQKPLEILSGTEGVLRRQIVKIVYPLLPKSTAENLQDTSLLAEESLRELVAINVAEISDRELRSPRIFIGLTFVGLSALGISFLLLYLSTAHSDLALIQQIGYYWYQYVFLVCLGVAGLLLLGREAMRQPQDNE